MADSRHGKADPDANGVRADSPLAVGKNRGEATLSPAQSVALILRIFPNYT